MISKKILTIRINTLDLLDLLVRLADLVICPSYTPFLWNLPLISFIPNRCLRIAPPQSNFRNSTFLYCNMYPKNVNKPATNFRFS